jgi:hypothetical protein
MLSKLYRYTVDRIVSAVNLHHCHVLFAKLTLTFIILFLVGTVWNRFIFEVREKAVKKLISLCTSLGCGRNRATGRLITCYTLRPLLFLTRL